MLSTAAMPTASIPIDDVEVWTSFALSELVQDHDWINTHNILQRKSFCMPSYNCALSVRTCWGDSASFFLEMPICLAMLDFYYATEEDRHIFLWWNHVSFWCTTSEKISLDILNFWSWGSWIFSSQEMKTFSRICPQTIKGGAPISRKTSNFLNKSKSAQHSWTYCLGWL